MQGLASAGAIPAAQGILGANYGPGKRKNTVFAIFSAGNPVGSTLGLIIGGILTSYLSWRWVMWFIGIFATLDAVGSFFIIPKDEIPGHRDPLDWGGTLFITSGLILFCFGLTYALYFRSNGRGEETAPDGWKTWWIILCLVAGLVLIGGFVLFESRISNPLMPLNIWRIPQFAKVIFCFGLGFGIFSGALMTGWSLYYQQIYQASPITVSSPSLTLI